MGRCCIDLERRPLHAVAASYRATVGHLASFHVLVPPQTVLTATVDVRNPAVVDALPCVVVEAPIRHIGRERVFGSPITAPEV
jgi:hypothetical protein